MTQYKYVVHSDIDENNVKAEFDDRDKAIAYAKDHAANQTWVEEIEVVLNDANEVIDEYPPVTIWEYLDNEDLFGAREEDPNDFAIEFPKTDNDADYIKEIESKLAELRSRLEEVEKGHHDEFTPTEIATLKATIEKYEEELYFAKQAKEYEESQWAVDVPADWDDPNRMPSKHEDLRIKEAVKDLEEHENEVECKCCFELFPKEACTKTDDGYICPRCGQEKHSHQGTNLDLVDANPFDLDYDDPRLPEEEPEPEVKEEPVDGAEIRKHEKAIVESQSQEIGDYYKKFSKQYGVDLDELVYGDDGFMKSCYPDGFPDFNGDVIYSEKYWAEFEKWLKETKGIVLEENLEEHVNEEHPAIESDQELHGMDNAVVDCQTDMKVIAHSEDEKPLDCKMEKAPLEKPLTEETVEEAKAASFKAAVDDLAKRAAKR